MKEVKVKLEVHDDDAKKKVERAASRLPGNRSVRMNMEEKILIVTGYVYKEDIMRELKDWSPVVLSVEAVGESGSTKKK